MAENEYTAKKVILKNNQGEYLIPYVEFPIATETSAGIVQPDNSTISVNNGTISVSENVYTKDNLSVGNGLEITEPITGGIDEYTLAVAHFEGSSITENAVESGNPLYAPYSSTFNTTYFKFGTKGAENAFFGYTNTGLIESSDWTVDFWAFYSSSISGDIVGGICSDFGKYPKYTWSLFYSYLTKKLTIYKGFNWSSGAGEEKTSISFNFPENQWAHFAVEKHNNTINGYINGELVISYTNDEVINEGNCSFGTVCQHMDELRFSTIARYKGESFTSPTEPYAISTSSANTINLLTDNETISVSNGTITAEGIKTKNDVLKYDWIGTKSEWEVGRGNGIILDSWVCYITDDFVQTDTSGTMNYNELENIPTIGGIELKGNKELGELGIQSKLTAGNGITIENNIISSTATGSSSTFEMDYDETTKTLIFSNGDL